MAKFKTYLIYVSLALAFFFGMLTWQGLSKEYQEVGHHAFFGEIFDH